MRARCVDEIPIDLDKHRGMAAQKATDIRRVLAEVAVNAKVLRARQGMPEIELWRPRPRRVPMRPRTPVTC